jgi:hypothetical protein
VQTASVAVAIGLNKFIQSSPTLSKGVIGRFVPLLAVGAANCVNIPLMRQAELTEGITVSTKEGEEIGKSKAAAFNAVAQVKPTLRLPHAHTNGGSLLRDSVERVTCIIHCGQRLGSILGHQCEAKQSCVCSQLLPHFAGYPITCPHGSSFHGSHPCGYGHHGI